MKISNIAKALLSCSIATTLLFVALPSALASGVPGTKCSTAGQKMTISGRTYTCIKLGSNKYWDNGVTKSIKLTDQQQADIIYKCMKKFWSAVASTARSIYEAGYAQTMDCVEQKSSQMYCRESKTGWGPICGLRTERTGFPLAGYYRDIADGWKGTLPK